MPWPQFRRSVMQVCVTAATGKKTPMRAILLYATLLIASAWGQYVHCQIRPHLNAWCESAKLYDSALGWDDGTGNVYANLGTGFNLPFYLMSPSPTTECIEWYNGDYYRSWVDVSVIGSFQFKGACIRSTNPHLVEGASSTRGVGSKVLRVRSRARIPLSQAQSIPPQIAPTRGQRLRRRRGTTTQYAMRRARETSPPALTRIRSAVSRVRASRSRSLNIAEQAALATSLIYPRTSTTSTSQWKRHPPGQTPTA